MKILNFLNFPGSFLPSWIRIRIHWPDWIRIQYGSGSATLVLDWISSTYGTDFFLRWFGPVLGLNSSCFLDRFLLVLGEVSSRSKTKRISFSYETDILQFWNGYPSVLKRKSSKFGNRYRPICCKGFPFKWISYGSGKDLSYILVDGNHFSPGYVVLVGQKSYG